MQVTLNIEPGMLGETVIDLFQNLSKKKKEELALTILREWLVSPELFETPNHEAILIEEFRTGKRQPSWSSTKYNKDTPAEEIQRDYKYKELLEEYQTSKQVMAEKIKKEIIEYYTKHLAEEIKKSPEIIKLRDDLYNTMVEQFPSIMYDTMVRVLVSNLSMMQDMVIHSNNQVMMSGGMLTHMQQVLREKGFMV